MGENGLAGPTLRFLPKTRGFSVFLARISKRSNRNTFSCPDAFETRRVVVPCHTSKLVLLGMEENGLAGPTLRFLPKTHGYSVFLARISKRSNRNTFSCPDAFETRMVVATCHTAKLVLLGMGENGLAGPTLRFLPKTHGISVFLARISKRSNRNTFPCPDAFETRRVVATCHTAMLVLLGTGENGLAGPTLPFLPKTRGFSVFLARISKRSNRNTFSCPDAFETRRVVATCHTAKLASLGMGENGLAGPTLRFLPKTRGFSVFLALISKRSNRNTFPCPDTFETRMVVVPRHTAKLVSLGMGETDLQDQRCDSCRNKNTRLFWCFWRGFRNGGCNYIRFIRKYISCKEW